MAIHNESRNAGKSYNPSILGDLPQLHGGLIERDSHTIELLSSHPPASKHNEPLYQSSWEAVQIFSHLLRHVRISLSILKDQYPTSRRWPSCTIWLALVGDITPIYGVKKKKRRLDGKKIAMDFSQTTCLACTVLGGDCWMVPMLCKARALCSS